MKYIILSMLTLLLIVSAEAQTVIDNFSHVGKMQDKELPNPMAVVQSMPDVSNDKTMEEQAKEMLPIDNRDEQMNSEGEALEEHTKMMGITNTYSPSRDAKGTASNNRVILISNQPWYKEAAPITSYVSANIENGHVAVMKELDSKDTWLTFAYRFYNESNYEGTLAWPGRSWGVYVDVSEASEDVEMICSVTVSYPVRSGRRDNPVKILYVNKYLSGKVKTGRAYFNFADVEFYKRDEEPETGRDENVEDVIKIVHVALSARTRSKDSSFAIDQITIGEKNRSYTKNNNAGKPVYKPIPRAAVLPDGSKVKVDNVQE